MVAIVRDVSGCCSIVPGNAASTWNWCWLDRQPSVHLCPVAVKDQRSERTRTVNLEPSICERM